MKKGKEKDCELCKYCISVNGDMELFCTLLDRIVWETCEQYEDA